MCTKHQSLSVLKSKKTEFGISPTQMRHLQTWGKKEKKKGYYQIHLFYLDNRWHHQTYLTCAVYKSFLVTVVAAGDFPNKLKEHNLLVYPTGSLTTLKKRILVLDSHPNHTT